MYSGKTVFAQLMDCLPWSTFSRLVARYGGDYDVRTFPCVEQYRAMAFAQLTYRESLRDIEACLSAQPAKLYHMGFRGPIRRSTLADANETRDWRIYAEFAQRLIAQARRLYVGESSVGRFEGDRLRVGLDHHRFVPVVVPVGAFPVNEGRGEDAHIAGFARQHPELYPYFRRQAARCACARYARARGRCDLRHGPWVCRLRPSVRAASGRRFFRDPRQIQPQCSSGVFGRHRSHDRRDRRSDDHAGRALHAARIIRCISGGSASGIPKPERRLCFSPIKQPCRH